MASTTTTTTTRATVSQVLVDYDLHHSNSTPAAAKEEGQQAAATSSSSNNPPGWDAHHRRVPPHRPVNRHLDQSQRNVYQDTGERIFITVMFSGLFINSTATKVWNATLGRLNENLFRYPLGGEI